MTLTKKFLIGLGVLIVLSPLGLILPDHFKAGDAWGEWGPEKFKDMIGYIPQGLEKLSSLWNAPMPDYAFKGWEGKPLTDMSFAYIVSAIVGIALIAAITFFLGKALVKDNE